MLTTILKIITIPSDFDEQNSYVLKNVTLR